MIATNPRTSVRLGAFIILKIYMLSLLYEMLPMPYRDVELLQRWCQIGGEPNGFSRKNSGQYFIVLQGKGWKNTKKALLLK